MTDLNQCSFIGRLGADPEIRRTQNGTAIANLRLAVSETWRDKSSGERKEKTEWVSVVVFSEGLVKVIESYAQKGSRMFVQGKLATRKWQDQSGNDRYSTEVVLQGFDAKIQLLDSQGGGGNSAEPKSGKRPDRGSSHDPLDDLDMIPF